MVAMVAAKMKITYLPKKTATTAHLAESTPVATLAAPTVPSKQLRPKTKMTGNVARPKKHLKKKAKKGKQEIHVISSQTTGSTTPSAHISSPVNQVSAEVSPKPSILTVGHATIQPTT